MNWIEKMIAEQCPQGVKRIKLGEVCEISTGTKPNTIETTGSYKYINAGTTESGYCQCFNTLGDTVTTPSRGQGGIGFVGYQRTNFWCGPLCYRIKAKTPTFLNRYLYLYLSCHNELILVFKCVGGTPAINRKDIESIEIPLPPLSIQEKIVDVLDKFTELIEKTDEEIALRQKQYEYYREKLLTFEEGEAEWMKLGDLFEFKNGLNKEKKAFGHGTPIVNYTDVYKKRGLKREDVKGLVELNKSEINRFNCKKGDVFFTRTSETKEEVGFPSVLLDDIEHCTFSGFVLRARSLTDLLLPHYCKYCFFTYYFRQQVIKSATLTTRALTNGKSLSKITIPVPSPSRQQEIVATLDKFESLIASLKEERELRQKQYEYYREKLLTF